MAVSMMWRLRLHCRSLLKVMRLSSSSSSSSSSSAPQKPFNLTSLSLKTLTLQNPNRHLHPFNFLSSQRNFSAFSSAPLRSFSTSNGENGRSDETDGDLVIEEWEEEDDAIPEIDDGGAGGGIVLQNVPWGEQVLSLAREVMLQFADDIKLYAFKTTPRGYIYVRLDKLSNEYGCPSMDEIESYSREYKKRLEEEGSRGQIPDDLALEVSSPGAERLLRVPDDLDRFKDFPMFVSYIEGDGEAKSQENSGVFLLDSIETNSEHCIWKLADVRENRDPAGKGRPLSRKKKDWRLKLPFSVMKRVTLYLD